MLTRSKIRAKAGTRWKRRGKLVNNFSAAATPSTGGHSGAMIALRIPDDVTREVWVAGGKPQADLHITLVYVKGENLDLSLIHI